MAEILITSTQQLETVFASCPKHLADQERHLLAIAEEFNKEAAVFCEPGNTSELSGIPVQMLVRPAKQNEKATGWIAPDFDVEINGKGVHGFYIEFRAEYSGDSWRARPTGKMRCTVGDYGDKVSYPERKDGTFGYESIAKKLIATAARKVREARTEAARRSNQNIVGDLKAKHGIKEHDDIVCASYAHWTHNGLKTVVAPEGYVYVRMTKALSPEQADKLLAFLKTL